MASNAVIIGAGVGGLAAAVRLAAKGVRVTVFEKGPRVGGKLNLCEIPHPHRPADRPFRFDTGPSLLTLPFIFADLFAAAGEDVRDHLPIKRLDPIARFQWGDGTQFSLRAESEAIDEELRRIAPEDIAGWKHFIERGRRIWDLSAELFLFHTPEQILKGKHTGASSPAWAGLQMLTVPFRIGMFARFSSWIERDIRNPKLREVLYQYATYSGASPFKAPATLSVIPHAEMHFGGWYIEGGMYRLASALEAVARKLGVEIRLNSPVQKILTESNQKQKKPRRARGVQLADGTEIISDAVVANSDVVYTYRELISPADRPHRSDAKLDRLEPGGSGMVLLLGVEGTYPQLAHHTKFMPEDYRSDLSAMFETRTVPGDPCIYVCASTRTDPTQAPEGCENLFVLASAPPLNGKLDWATAGPRYRDQLVRTLEHKWGLVDLSKRIIVERSITPDNLRALYNANAGSIYGIGSNSRRSAFLRPPNRDGDVAGLYFAGGATHPGGGLPLVALSGKIASELVLEDLAAGTFGRQRHS